MVCRSASASRASKTVLNPTTLFRIHFLPALEAQTASPLRSHPCMQVRATRCGQTSTQPTNQVAM